MKKQPLILAVETSGRSGSVALAKGPDLLEQIEFSAPIRHSAEIFPAISDLCRQFNHTPNQIQQVYLSVGPGSFTGLRIAVTIAKTFHLANAAKIVPVTTSDCLAQNASDSIEQDNIEIQNIATILDAKRGQFFTAAFKNQNGAWQKTLPDCLMTAPQFLEKFADSSSPLWLLGEGLVYHKDKFTAENIKFLDPKYWTPAAKKVHLLGYQIALKGNFADPLALRPNYLRAPDVKQKTNHTPKKIIPPPKLTP